jgi:hypothetical protein
MILQRVTTQSASEVHVPMADVPLVHSPKTASQVPVLDRRQVSKLAFPQVDRAAQRFTFPLQVERIVNE